MSRICHDDKELEEGQGVQVLIQPDGMGNMFAIDDWVGGTGLNAEIEFLYVVRWYRGKDGRKDLHRCTYLVYIYLIEGSPFFTLPNSIQQKLYMVCTLGNRYSDIC